MVRRRKPTGGFNKSSDSGKNRSAPKSGNKSSRGSKNAPIPQDEEDLFFEGRDKILLDGNDSSSRGRDLEDYDDEEEVFALKGLDDSDSDVGDYDDADDVEDESDEDGDSMDEDETPQAPVKPTRKAATKSKAKPSKEDDEDAESDSDSEERWGKNKSAYYSSNAKELDSDDEEARQLEEQEAMRLQAKAREGITDDDFGLNDLSSLTQPGPDSIAEPNRTSGTATAVAVTSIPLDKASVIRQLERTNPEVLALAREWEDIALQMRKLDIAVDQRTKADPNHPSLGMIHLHQQTVLTYAAVLAHYLHVRSTPIPGPTPNAPTTAKAVPDKVLERLLQLKHSLSVLEDIGFSALESDNNDPLEYGSGSRSDSDEGSEEEDSEPDWDIEAKYSDAQIDAILNEIEHQRGADDARNSSRAQRMARAKERASTAAAAKPSTTVHTNGSSSTNGKEEKLTLKIPAKKKKQAKSTEPDPSPSSSKIATAQPPVVFDLEERAFGSYAKSQGVALPASSSNSTSATYNAFGEATSLSTPDLADKAARKKSLKFHTNKIESASRRREAARTRALGGDDDIPWKDQRTARREREKKEAEAATTRPGGGKAGQGGDDLDDRDPSPSVEESDKKGKKRARDDVDDDGEGEEGADGYYELVKKSKKQAKVDKQAAYDAEVAANKPDFSEDSSSGPRSLTRAILKNKGLTPKRAKAVRNPRVKKKLRFEQAKKRVASKRAVFQGGMASLPGGRYDGERSGISTVVKSVKL